jgi:hypothetical protein
MSFSAKREAAGLTLDDVAKNWRLDPARVKGWEDGVGQPPQYISDTLSRLGASETAPGIQPRQPEFPATRDERPLFKPGNLIKSKKRVADHGEVFTPPWLVERMLDLVKGESERIDSRFLEPACGSGNFLVAVLKRKLATVQAKYGKSAFNKKLYALQALACCYGIELLEDNIAECRANMLDVFAAFLGSDAEDDFYRAASHILSLNLVHGDAMTMQTVPANGAAPGPIMIVEWAYTGKAGKFIRRDFRLEVLTQASGFNRRWAAPDSEQEVSLFAEARAPFHHRGRDPIFVPVASYPPMTVRDLAARDQGAAA